MSAFVVTPEHIAYLVRAAVVYGRQGWIDYAGEKVDGMNADAVASALMAENVASVNHRYSHHDGREEPEPVHVGMMSGRGPVAVQVLKAIDCYVYQSCEHDGWKTSAAKDFCDRLRSAAISRLDGYEDADWEIVAPPTREQVRAALAAAGTPMTVEGIRNTVAALKR